MRLDLQRHLPPKSLPKAPVSLADALAPPSGELSSECETERACLTKKAPPSLKGAMGALYHITMGSAYSALGASGAFASSAFAAGSAGAAGAAAGFGACFTTGAWGTSGRTCRSPCTCRSPHGPRRPQRGWHQTYRCARTCRRQCRRWCTACLPQHPYPDWST